MRLTTLLRRLLGVTQMYVKQVEMAADGPLTVSVEPAWRRSRCGTCGKRAPRYDRQPVREWRHLSWGRMPAWLRYAPWRVSCRRCSGVKVEQVPWASGSSVFTSGFEELAAYLAQVTDRTAVSRLLGISWVTVGSIVGTGCGAGCCIHLLGDPNQWTGRRSRSTAARWAMSDALSWYISASSAIQWTDQQCVAGSLASRIASSPAATPTESDGVSGLVRVGRVGRLPADGGCPGVARITAAVGTGARSFWVYRVVPVAFNRGARKTSGDALHKVPSVPAGVERGDYSSRRFLQVSACAAGYPREVFAGVVDGLMHCARFALPGGEDGGPHTLLEAATGLEGCG